VCGPQEGHCEKRCEIQGGGQEWLCGRLIAKILITTIQVDLVPNRSERGEATQIQPNCRY